MVTIFDESRQRRTQLSCDAEIRSLLEFREMARIFLKWPLQGSPNCRQVDVSHSRMMGSDPQQTLSQLSEFCTLGEHRHAGALHRFVVVSDDLSLTTRNRVKRVKKVKRKYPAIIGFDCLDH
jgi:hypothetical protein